jgi:ceramide glucosyltransferase
LVLIPLAIVWCALAAVYALSVVLTLVRFGKTRAPETGPAPCSIILPVKGVHPFLSTNVEALVAAAPADAEILLAVAAEEDPAMAVLAPLARRHPQRVALLVGKAPEFANPKLSNLAKAYRAARADVLVFVDGSVAASTVLFQELLARLDFGTALVTAAPLGYDAENLPAEIEAATCNGYLFRIEMLLEFFGIAAAFGNALALRKRDLEAEGGLRRLAEGPCEDNALSKALGRRGRITLLPVPAVRRIGRRNWREIGQRHLRWTNCAKCHDPIMFALEPLIGGLCFNFLGAFALAAMLSASWRSGLALSLAIWYGAEAMLHLFCHWPMSVKTPIAWVLRDLLQPLITMLALFTRRVMWRGAPVEMRIYWRRFS